MKNKNLTLITEAGLATIAGLTLANSNVVKAETTKSNSHSVVQKEADAAARSELEAANSEVSAKQAEVEKSSQSLNSAQAKYNVAQQNQANAQSKMGQVDPDAVAAAKQNVAEKQDVLAKSQQDFKSAQDDAQAAQQNLTVAQNKNKAAQDAVTQQQKKIDQAQATLNALKNNSLTDDQVAGAKQAYAQASAEVNKQQTAVAKASKELAGKQQVLATFQANAAQAQNNKKSSDADLAAAQTAVNAAQSRRIAAVNAEKMAQALVNNLGHNVVNHFVLNDAYIQTMHNAQKKNDELEKQKKGASVDDQVKIIVAQERIVDEPAFINAIRSASDQLWQMNRYVSNEVDQKRIVDFDHLSASQLLELNKFTASLLNDARVQVGSQPLILNKSAMEFAENVKEEYQNNNKSNIDGHYIAGIQRAAEKSGLANDNQFYENMNSFDTSLTPLKSNSEEDYRLIDNPAHLGEHQATMDEVKHNIYNGLKQMLFADDEWEHTTSLLSTIHNSASTPVYFGASFSVLPGSSKVSTHYELIKSKYIDNPSRFNEKDNIALTDTTDQQAQIAAKADLTAKTQAAEAANEALTKAQQAQDAAQKKAAEATSYLTSVSKMVAASQASVEQATQELTAAKEKLAEARTAQEQAGQVLAGFNNSSANNGQVLTAAQKVLDREVLAMTPLRAQLQQSSQNLAAASQKVNAKNQAVTAAQKQVTTNVHNLHLAQTNLINLLNAAQSAGQAQANFDQAKKALEKAQKQLEADQASLVTAQARQKAAQEKYDAVKAAQAQVQQTSDSNNLAQQVKDEQDRLQQVETVLPNSKILQTQDKQPDKPAEFTSKLYLPVLHNDPNWKVRILDDQGHYLDKYIFTNKTIKVLAKKIVAGKTFYKIGENEWIPAQLTMEIGKESKMKGIAFMPRLKEHPSWKVAMMDSNGNYTGKYLTTNSSWIIWGKKVIKGRLCYRLGTQAQWVPAEYLIIK